jgi:hypothetical protein
MRSFAALWYINELINHGGAEFKNKKENENPFLRGFVVKKYNKLNGKRQGAAYPLTRKKGTFGQSNASGFQALSPNVWKVVNPFSSI